MLDCRAIPTSGARNTIRASPAAFKYFRVVGVADVIAARCGACAGSHRVRQ
jgi:hypothetical protein